MPSSAAESGRICAVAGQGQREMLQWAKAYPALYSAKPFDPALFSTLALATAFSGPWLDRTGQRMANRVTLWCFGLDWLVDYAAKTRDEVVGIAERCLAVAAGQPPEPGDDLTRFLADIRAELSAARAYPALGAVWHDELRRMLDAMLREYDWKAADTRPSFADYLQNADNLGFSFVFASHWTCTTTEPVSTVDVERVRAASWAVQRVIRLLNDLATYDRDVHWGDLNALLLGPTRTELRRRIGTLAEEARRLAGGLRAEQPRVADYLVRQMEFCMGFYGVADYWGEL